ncbi:unnamed protein product, partial [Iphiclides podalirius]
MLRSGSRACVSCGKRAESFCGRCEVTPYCGERCQWRDWAERHRAVCHNLARLVNVDAKEASASPAPDLTVIEPVVPKATPLRRPHSPANQKTNWNQRSEDTDGRQVKNYSAGQQNTGRSRQASNRNDRFQDNKHKKHNRAPARQHQNSQQADGVEEEWAIGTQPSPHRTSRTRPARATSSARRCGLRTRCPRPTLSRRPTLSPQADLKTKADLKPKTDIKPQADLKTKADLKPKADIKPQAEVKAATSAATGPAALDNVTPRKKIVPKKCLIELLSVGDVVMLSVDGLASECRAGSTGYVCLALCEAYGGDYEALYETYAAACEADADAYKPAPGQSFSYRDPADGSWYRARCLGPSLCSLLDNARLVTLKPEDSLKKLPQEFAELPEFCCLLKADNVKIGDSLRCTVKCKLADGCRVAIEAAESGAPLGEGEVSRWLPEVEHPAPAPPLPGGGAVGMATVPRPDLKGGSRVLLVEAADPKAALVRGADSASVRRYDEALHGVALYGQGATPLNAPPQKGQLVISKFSDGVHYRALCKRTSVKQNKYLLEYIEFGNVEIAKLEDIYPCPPEFDLDAMPAEASVVNLRCEVTALTAPATEYIERLKDSVELILSLCSGAETEPSGAEVELVVADTKKSVNRKLEEMCTPEWKKMEQRGEDAVESATLMFSDLEYLELPPNGCEIVVLDVSPLEGGTVSGYKVGEPLAKTILEELPKELEAYCNSALGREPYLPKIEELCVARCPPYEQWFRAVLCEQVRGAGGASVRLCYVDYGNVECVAATELRKMMPEFVRGRPALAAHLEIRDFPKEPTGEMLARALQHMKYDESKGLLRVTRCEKIESGMYLVDAPDLIKAMLG